LRFASLIAGQGHKGRNREEKIKEHDIERIAKGQETNDRKVNLAQAEGQVEVPYTSGRSAGNRPAGKPGWIENGFTYKGTSSAARQG